MKIKTHLAIWKNQLQSRVPVLLEDVEEAVFLPPRMAHAVYNIFILGYWSVVGIISTFIILGKFFYRQGVNSRNLWDAILIPKNQSLVEVGDRVTNLEPELPLIPSSDRISLDTLSPSARRKVLDTPSHLIPLARPWGKGWRVTTASPEELATYADPWKVVNREDGEKRENFYFPNNLTIPIPPK